MGWRIALDDGVAVADERGASYTPRARKARALLAYLALKHSHSASRREIAKLLWSDRGPEQARASLRQCLFELKSEAPSLILATGEEVALCSAVTIAGVPNPSLGDLSDLDPAFDSWRERLLPQHPIRLAPPRRKRYRLAVGAAALAASAALLWGFHGRPTQFAPDLALASYGLDAASTEAFADAARQAMPGRYLHVREGMDARRVADWIISAAPPVAGLMFVRIDTNAGEQLWSEHLPLAGDSAKVAAELGRRAGETALCTTRAPGGPPREPDLLILLMDVCGKLARRDETADVLIAARRLTAAYPSFAFGHAILAMNLSYGATSSAAADGSLAEAGREARRALALDPRTGEAWMALGDLARKQRQYRLAEALLRRGLAVQPDHGSLNNYLAGLLTTVGRNDEALVYARRAAALDPASPLKLATVAELLARIGRPRAALALVDQAEQERGESVLFRRVRLELLEQSGDIAGAQALFDNAGGGPAFLEPADELDTRRVLALMREPSAPIPRDLRNRLAAHAAGIQVLERALVGTGRTSEAVALAETGRLDPSSLFGTDMAPLWRDRRFPDIARALQLWQYWVETGQWPDICADRALNWRCGDAVKTPSTPS